MPGTRDVPKCMKDVCGVLCLLAGTENSEYCWDRGSSPCPSKYPSESTFSVSLQRVDLTGEKKATSLTFGCSGKTPSSLTLSGEGSKNTKLRQLSKKVEKGKFAGVGDDVL